MSLVPPFAKRYAQWLHLRWPAGGVEPLPEVADDGTTAVAGLYVAGDLTGIPLLKLSADGGARAVQHMARAGAFDEGGDSLDLVIIGAGVAGMAAALEARELGLRFEILDAQRPFSTLYHFPVKKPIYAYPIKMRPAGQLSFNADIREGLIHELEAQTRGVQVRAASATHVERQGASLAVHLSEGEPLLARRVLVAIGRSGNHRELGVPGEDLPHVSNRLHDPADFSGGAVVVVGGGDSAVEAAIALAEAGARTTLSYRRTSLTRPKPANLERATALARNKAGLTLALGTRVTAITRDTVCLEGAEGTAEIPADAVFTLIGREAPLAFFRRSKVPIRGEWTRKSIAACLAFVFLCFGLYNWKSGGFLADMGAQAGAFPFNIAQVVNDVEPIPPQQSLGAEPPHVAQSSLGARRPWAYLEPIPPDFTERANAAMARLSAGDYTDSWDEKGHLERQVAAGKTHRAVSDDSQPRSPSPSVFPGRISDRTSLLGTVAISAAGPSFWYTLAYVILVLVFGLRRIRRRDTPYITAQTAALMLIQALPLFILPEILLPLMGYHGLMGPGLADALFPAVDYGHGREYWRAYGLILAWPLNIYNWQTEEPLWAWLAIGGVQTFVIIPLLVWRFGKGAYCGWICSCGALAETLGDGYRERMPHGPMWNRLNMLGQVILAVAAVMMVMRVVTWVAPDSWALKQVLYVAKDGSSAPDGWAWLFSWLNYKWTVDVLLAGILGYGVYFWMSGRAWCRFACPLAALMHIYARFSRFRIFADKKKCISCNVCTSVCHQGIDVMGFANKGKAMKDPECVRCSACVHACPTGTLAFGATDADGKPAHLDSLLASPVHRREGEPSLDVMGDDDGHLTQKAS